MSFKSGRRPVMPISHYFSRYFYGVKRDVNKAKVRCKLAVFDFFPMMLFGPCPTPPGVQLFFGLVKDTNCGNIQKTLFILTNTCQCFKFIHFIYATFCVICSWLILSVLSMNSFDFLFLSFPDSFRIRCMSALEIAFRVTYN